MPSGDPYEDYANGYGPYPGYGAYLFGDDPDQGSGSGGGEGGGGSGSGAVDNQYWYGSELEFIEGTSGEYFYLDQGDSGGGGQEEPPPNWCEGWDTVTQMGISAWWGELNARIDADAYSAVDAANAAYATAISNGGTPAAAAAAAALAVRAAGGLPTSGGQLWDHWISGPDPNNPNIPAHLHEFYSWEPNNSSWEYVGTFNNNGQLVSTAQNSQNTLTTLGPVGSHYDGVPHAADGSYTQQENPTVQALMTPYVDQKIAEYYAMSNPNDSNANNMREHGLWFYQSETDLNDIIHREKPPAVQNAQGIYARIPEAPIPQIPGYRLIIDWHDHMAGNRIVEAPTAQDPGRVTVGSNQPSVLDVNTAFKLGVLGVVTSPNGNYYYGPNSGAVDPP